MRISLGLLFLLIGFSPAVQANFGLCKWVYKTPTKHEINLDLASRAGLRYLETPEAGISRKLVGTRQKDQRKEYVFEYTNWKGELVTDEATLTRIAKLRLPPAYNNVWISADPSTHIQARGTDARGRVQVRMHELWDSQVKGVRKYIQVAEFGTLLPNLHRKVEAELQKTTLTETKSVAAVVRLLEVAGIRVGNEKYAQENGSFGLTTLRVSHVVQEGNTLRFVFVGKEGVHHDITIQDSLLVGAIRQLIQNKSADDLVFNVSDTAVNEFIKQHTSSSFSAKDFRTWVANTTAIKVLIAGGSEKEALLAASRRLTNEPATVKAHYISPKIFEMHRDGSLEMLYRNTRQNNRPHEETIAILILKETSS